MGHGDEIAIVDANFPATSHARRLIRADGSNAVQITEAVLALMPLDSYELPAAFSMQVVGDSEAVPPIVTEFQSVIDRVADHPSAISPVERHEFYARARDAFAIVVTGEFRLYGNLVLKKGVVAPDESVVRLKS